MQNRRIAYEIHQAQWIRYLHEQEPMLNARVLLASLIVSLLVGACAPSGKMALPDDADRGSIELPPDEGSYKPAPLLWEQTRTEGLLWSAFSYQLIASSSVGSQLLPGSEDIQKFCTRYYSLEKTEQINFWAYLVSAISKYESGHNPLSRFHESTMGTDPVTGLPVHSEGLLQLSYQDIKSYKFCKFDWKADRKLEENDPKRTILNPLLNLDCGIRILAQQIEKKKRIALSGGVYWAVLKEGGRYSRLNEISTLTQGLPFCN